MPTRFQCILSLFLFVDYFFCLVFVCLFVCFFFDSISFGLKLLNIILERNPTFISTVNRLNLTQKFFDFFQLDNPNNNITNIKLIKKLVESPDIDKKILFQNGMPPITINC